MLFNTFDFVLFFAIVLAGSAILPHRPRLYFLLGSSYFFYGYWNWQYTALLLLSTAIDFFAALGIQKATTSSRKKLFLIISILMNLSLLGIFKYYNFFAQSVAPWVHWNMPELQVLLPVGISFYTFQSMSYTIDVYRGVLEPRRSFVDFALYVSFFPQLVAGPIVRAKDFLPQLDSKPRVTSEQIRSGMHLILRGYIEKVVIADNLGPIVEKIYSNPAAHSGADLWIATYCFAFQIFCDFAGYTDIARGCARLLGYEFLENFRRPYLATDIVDFWRRWHISLSTWLRDYLYIPLGGSHKGLGRTYVNLMLTMLLGGLWHGANWTFLWWGFYHGFLLCVTRFFQHYRKKDTSGSPRRWVVARPFQVLLTFHLVCIGWVLFRAESIQLATQMLKSMFTFPLGSATLLPYAYFCGFLYLAMTLHEYANIGTRFERWPVPVRTFIIFIALLSLAIFVPAKRVAFIYFQF
jgi:alginate O-acetyltransferase complex protein AlgI